MYEVGDLVVYGSSGVYRVDEVGPIRHIRGYNPEQNYYKLVSSRHKDQIYVPVDGKVFLRPVMNADQAEELMDHADGLPDEICRSREPRVLREYYQQMLDAHNAAALVRLIRSVNAKGRNAASQGRRLGKVDLDYKKRAESLLGEELSAAMDISFEDAQAMLSQRVRSGA